MYIILAYIWSFTSLFPTFCIRTVILMSTQEQVFGKHPCANKDFFKRNIKMQTKNTKPLHLVLWHSWLWSRKDSRPVKNLQADGGGNLTVTGTNDLCMSYSYDCYHCHCPQLQVQRNSKQYDILTSWKWAVKRL